MEKKYSQLQAMLAIAKASLAAQFKSPAALVFGFAFPLFFILIFGSGRGGGPSVRVAFDKNSDTRNEIWFALNNVPVLNINKDTSAEVVNDKLSKGRLTAVLSIQPSADSLNKYIVNVQSSSASNPQQLQLLRSIISSVITSVNKNSPAYNKQKSVGDINMLPQTKGRIYRAIDFVLPGQLGFSLLSAGLFGIAFLFFNLRETLVLKRMNATPIRRPYIILGEALARIIFQLIITAIILLLGKYAFRFTLVHGWLTFFELMVLSFIGLIVFMGFGFFISGASKNINTIPVMTNLLGFPQFMLAGTFFPVENLPGWLQTISKILPLTHLNDAMRNIAFEGSHLTDCGKQIGILALWGLVIYFFAIRAFKWE